MKGIQALPTRDFGFLPAVLAASRGFFTEEGLDMELPVMTPNTAIPALINREIQFGSAASSVRAGYQGAPLRAVFYQYSYSTFLAVGASDVRTYKDIRGKAIAVESPGGSEDLAVKLLLKREDIPLSEVQIAALGPRSQRLPAIYGGQVQFTLAHPDLAVDLEQRGFNILGDLRDVLPIPWSGFAVHEDALRDQSDLVKAWLRANVRTLQFMKRNPGETAALAARELGLELPTAQRAIELLLPAISDDDPGGFTEAGLVINTQIDLEANGMSGDAAELGRRTHDVMLLRQVQRDLGIRCTGGYQCQ